MTYPKRLIEVDLPIKKISEHDRGRYLFQDFFRMEREPLLKEYQHVGTKKILVTIGD